MISCVLAIKTLAAEVRESTAATCWVQNHPPFRSGCDLKRSDAVLLC